VNVRPEELPVFVFDETTSHEEKLVKVMLCTAEKMILQCKMLTLEAEKDPTIAAEVYEKIIAVDEMFQFQL